MRLRCWGPSAASVAFAPVAIALVLGGLLVAGCTRPNPDYRGAGGTAVCNPPCAIGERCVRNRCILDTTFDGGLTDAGVEDLGPRPDTGGVDRIVRRDGRPDAPPPDVPPDEGPEICVPESRVCLDEVTAARCDFTGTGYTDVETCNEGDFCNPEIGQCTNNLVCEPGDSRCVDDAFVTERCREDGRGYEPQVCAPQFRCSTLGGPPNCYLERECRPGGYGCFGDFLVHCQANGVVIEQVEDCSALETASCQGKGVPGVTCCLSLTGSSLCCEDGGGCYTL